MKVILFLSPYFLLSVLAFSSPWFIFLESKFFIILNLFFLSVHIIFQIPHVQTRIIHFLELSNKFQKFGIFIFGLFSCLAIIFFPVRDVRLGDGILLLENMSLEVGIYGYQLITDEILEGLIHSITHNVLKSDPRVSFQIWSSFAGVILVFSLGRYFWNRKNGFYSFLLFISSGGFLLFYGYAENYSLTTAYLIGTTLFIARNVENNQKISPYLLGVIAAFGASLHLVFGYTIFGFVYLTWIFASSKREFFWNGIKSGLAAVLLLFAIFGYFFFFSDLRIDLGMSHITTHKFYPLKRWFSVNHFKEIFYCILFTSLPALFTLLYLFLFEGEALKSFLSSQLGKYLFLVLLGFLLHAFWHNPQLGFPADWDLMSFYWSVLVILSIKVLEKVSLNISMLILSYIFSFVLLQANAFVLTQRNLETEQKIFTLIENIQNFQKIYSKNPENIPPNNRKFHLHTYYFFFKTLKFLENKQAPKELIENGKNLFKEFELQRGTYTKEWKRDFLLRSTKFHEAYLEFMKKDL